MTKYIVSIKKAKDNTSKHKLFINIKSKEKDINLKIGAYGYDDYITSNSDFKKENYLKRHSVNQDWSISGIYKKGFWARWLLWNKATLNDSILDIQKRFKSIAII